MASPNFRHGHARRRGKTKEYRAWLSMISRCHPEHTQTSRRYYARGITVSPEWCNSFETFLSDVGFAPSPTYTLERLNNNQGYFPGNVAWKTQKDQMRNRKVTMFLTYGGITQPLTQWAEQLGLKASTIRSRLSRSWPIEKSLLTPIRRKVPYVHKGRATGIRNGQYTHPEKMPRGSKHWNAKITEEIATYIKRNPDGLTMKQLAQRFSISLRSAYYIREQRGWKHIPL